MRSLLVEYLFAFFGGEESPSVEGDSTPPSFSFSFFLFLSLSLSFSLFSPFLVDFVDRDHCFFSSRGEVRNIQIMYNVPAADDRAFHL